MEEHLDANRSKNRVSVSSISSRKDFYVQSREPELSLAHWGHGRQYGPLIQYLECRGQGDVLYQSSLDLRVTMEGHIKTLLRIQWSQMYTFADAEMPYEGYNVPRWKWSIVLLKRQVCVGTPRRQPCLVERSHGLTL